MIISNRIVLYSRFLLASLLFHLSLGQPTDYLDILTQPVNPDTTVFAFDWHHVLVTRKHAQIIKKTLGVIPKGMYWYMFHPGFLWTMISLARSGQFTSEAVFNQMAIKYPYIEKFRQDYYDVGNSHEPIDYMIELVRALKTKGYKVYLLTNIGELTFEDNRSKFPDIINLFDACFYPTQATNYTCKPNAEYYQIFKRYLEDNKLDHMQKIFIDDLLENVIGAYQEGIACIHCTDCKDTAQQIRELVGLSEGQ